MNNSLLCSDLPFDCSFIAKQRTVHPKHSQTVTLENLNKIHPSLNPRNKTIKESAFCCCLFNDDQNRGMTLPVRWYDIQWNHLQGLIYLGSDWFKLLLEYLICVFVMCISSLADSGSFYSCNSNICRIHFWNCSDLFRQIRLISVPSLGEWCTE